jgi:hypothetical protein
LKAVHSLLGLAFVAGLGLAGCATTEPFEWGNYDASLYAYSKHPEQLPQFEKSLRDAIASGRAQGRLAPGLQAELGYCYLGEGKRAEAIEQFKAEMTSFPEATPLMNRVIAQIQG